MIGSVVVFVGATCGRADVLYLSFSILCNQDHVDVGKATDFVAACGNFDGGFGATPGDESHAGQIFTAVGALAIGGALHHVDRDLLGW